MAGSLNKLMIIGNLGHDAELKYTGQGTAVLTCSVATTDNWNDQQGNKQSHTEWHRVQMWDKLAETLAPYLTKGKQVYVEGRLRTHKWQDKNGVDRYTTEVRADRVVLLGKKESNGGTGQGDGAPDGVDDEIPFAWLLPFLLPLTAAATMAGQVLAG